MQIAHSRRMAALALFAMLFVSAGAFAARDAHAANASVSIANFAFAPASASVNVGDTVTWTNAQPGVPHTVTSDAGAFDSGTLSSGGSFAFTFSAPGTFTYHCNIHPSMTGTVVIAGAAPQPTATATTAAAQPTATTAAPTATATVAAPTATTSAPTATATAGAAVTAVPTIASSLASPTPGAPATGDESEDGGGGSNAALIGLLIGAAVLAVGAGGWALSRSRR